jgi:threonylcarbamoyladenosine tRNA methylthiotransferase MtaB
VRDAATADLIVLNTCTVTHGADVDARRLIRGTHRDHPTSAILVTGCYAQRAPAEIAALDGVRWVVGNSHKAAIAEIVTTPDYHGQIVVGDISVQQQFLAAPVRDIRDDRTRPNLKVQDGCSNRCSFCIIPSVRGRSRSAPLASVLDQVRDLAARYCEVVLSGINLGRWGRDLPGGLRFVDLLRAILDETPVRRLRISSVEPMDWSQDLLELVASEARIAKHIHLPLQSGSDAVLKRMFRRYRTRHYASRLALAHSLMLDAAIGADVMTGFPGETDAEFAETREFIEQHPFAYLHVFTYSERPGTRAAEEGSPVPIPVRQERTRILRDLSDQKNLAFRRRMLGQTLSAVTLEQHGMALTSNFLKVEMGTAREANQIVDLRIATLTPSALREHTPFPLL